MSYVIPIRNHRVQSIFSLSSNEFLKLAPPIWIKRANKLKQLLCVEISWTPQAILDKIHDCRRRSTTAVVCCYS